jgi:hypothetical protein
MVRAKKTRRSSELHQAPRGNSTVGFPIVDVRFARRYRDITHAIIGDQGGADHCSESRQQLIRRFAAAAVLAEQLEAQLAHGERIDITAHALLTSTLVRIAQCIGIDRAARNTTPSLRKYLAAKTTEIEEVAK